MTQIMVIKELVQDKGSEPAWVYSTFWVARFESH